MIRIFMGAVFSTAGIANFLASDRFVKIIPGFIPFKKFLALFTGGLELIFCILLLTSRFKNWQLTSRQAFLWAVLMANIYMLTQGEKLGLDYIPRWVLILRLTLQWPIARLLRNLKKRMRFASIGYMVTVCLT